MGTLIRHASLPTTLPVLALAVAMAESALRDPLMPAVGTAPLLSSGVVATAQAAIAVAAIAVLTDKKHRLTTQA